MTLTSSYTSISRRIPQQKDCFYENVLQKTAITRVIPLSWPVTLMAILVSVTMATSMVQGIWRNLSS